MSQEHSPATLGEAATLTVAALDRMIESVEHDIGQQDVGNHGTIGFLSGELKGYRNARTYLVEAQARFAAAEPRAPFYNATGPLHVVCQCDKCKASVPSERGSFTVPEINVPSATPCSGWIPVSERVPPDHEYYLCAWHFVGDDSGEDECAVGYYGMDKKWTLHAGQVKDAVVTHWMPLPEAPHV